MAGETNDVIQSQSSWQPENALELESMVEYFFLALFYLKVSAAALARFALVRVVDEGARRAVEDEPALVPRAEARAHLVQVAPRRRRRQRHVAAQLHLRHHKKNDSSYG